MGAVLNKSVAADGVIAYRDHLEENKFHYWPARIDAVDGETLMNFQVDYYGVGAKPYYVSTSGYGILNVVGGVMSGAMVPDMTSSQRAKITEAITKAFGVSEPVLTPIPLENSKVQPVFAKNVVELGNGSSAIFPEKLQIGSQAIYNIGSGNSLFATMATMYNPNGGSSQFAVNVVGEAEFYGDPWQAEIEADLSQVWQYVRDQYETKASAGFLNISANISKTTQELIKSGIVKIAYIEGSGGEAFGRQLLETTKALFEKINMAAATGEGFFKFEPNPTPAPPDLAKDPLSSSLLPWTVSLNMGFDRESFTQKITFLETVTYTGKLKYFINTAMSVSLPCNSSTANQFYDVQYSQRGCMSPEKSQALQTRLTNEVRARAAKLAEYKKMWIDGKITHEMYKLLAAELQNESITETGESLLTGTGEVLVRTLPVAEAVARMEHRLMGHSLEDVRTGLIGDPKEDLYKYADASWKFTQLYGYCRGYSYLWQAQHLTTAGNEADIIKYLNANEALAGQLESDTKPVSGQKIIAPPSLQKLGVQGEVELFERPLTDPATIIALVNGYPGKHVIVSMHYTKGDQSHGAHAVSFIPSGQHWLFFDPNAGTFQLNTPEKFTAWWNNYYKAYFFTGKRTLRYVRLVAVEKLLKEVGQTVLQENLVAQ